MENHLTAEAVGDSDVSVAPNGRATLAVNASSDDNSHSYRWSKEVFYENEGGDSGWERVYFDDANEATLITDEITANGWYYCEVSDSYGMSVEVSFYVRVNNELSVQARNGNTTIMASPGDDVTLAVEVTAVNTEGLTLVWRKHVEDEDEVDIEGEKGEGDTTIHANNMGDTVELAVEASCNDGTPSYQWYEEGERIEGANSAAYTTKPIRREETEVYCHVNDDYGNTRDVWFYIHCDNYVDNALDVYAETENINLDPAQQAALTVHVDAVDKSDLSYRWFYQSKTLSKWGDWMSGDWVEIEDEPNEGTLTLQGSDAYTTWYRCEVSDQYGNSDSAEFNVCVDAGLEMDADWDNCQTKVPYGTPATLAVSVEGALKSLGWYRYSEEQGYSGIDDATGTTFTTPDVTAQETYYCLAIDKYLNIRSLGIGVYVDNQLSVQAKDGGSTIIVPTGSSATLAVEVSALDKQGMTFQWHKKTDSDDSEDMDWREMPDETGDTVELTDVREGGKYQCAVWDRFGNGNIVSFTVVVADESRIQPLTLNQDATANINNDGDVALFSFEVAEAGMYCFSASGVSYDTVGKICDVSWNPIASAEGYGFNLLQVLAAGVTYYLAASYRNGETGSFTVCLAKPEEYQDIQALTLGEASTANIAGGGQIAYFSYTPAQTGYYAFSSSADSDTFGYLYDDVMRQIAEDDDGGEGNNFKVMQQLTAGKTYYFGARYNSSGDTGSFDVLLERAQGLISASADQSDFTVASNTEVTLQVNAEYTEGETVSYQWFLDGESGPESINGETQPTYTVTVTRAAQYRCEVSDTHGNSARVDFEVSVDNGLQACRVIPAVEDEEDDTIHASMGETVSLEVEASCDDGTLSYQWYEAGDEIEGADSAAYTTRPIHRERTEVYCRVSDDYGNTRDVWFYIDCDNYVENNLEVRSDFLTVSPGETVTLEASVTAVDLTDATGQWSYRPKTLNDRAEWDYGDWVALGEAQTVTAEDGQGTVTYGIGDGELYSTEYRCLVTDKYGNTADVIIDVDVETGLEMDWDSQNTQFSVPVGESATLTTRMLRNGERVASVDGLVYSWYKRNGDYFEIISGETGTSYTIASVTWRDDYKCVAVDAYGNLYSRSDFVYVDNQLTASAANGERIIAVPSGAGLTLGVVASCLSGEDGLEYEWRTWRPSNEGAVQIPEATSDSYVIDAADEDRVYCCYVTDVYGNSADVEFSVTIIDPEAAIELKLNESKTVYDDNGWGQGVLFTYTPEETGRYAFHDEWEYGSPNYAALYDSAMTKLSSVESHDPFDIVYELTAGEKYYFKAGYGIRHGSDYFTVVLTKDTRLNNATELALDTPAAVDITEDGQIVYFSFTPTQTGYYTLSSEYDGDHATHGYLYNGNFQVLESETGWNDFTIRHQLVQGNTYYYGAAFDDGDVQGSYSVKLTRFQGLVSAYAEQSDITVAPNTGVTLRVNAVCTDGETLTYRWYRDGEEAPISGANGPTWALTVARNDQYRCEVSDAHGHEETLWFNLYVDSKLKAKVKGGEDDQTEVTLTASMLEEPRLEVEASCNEGTLSYQWYEEGERIEGANSADYTTRPIHRERTEVYCHVSDEYGNTRDIWFYIDCDNYVENNLQASTVNGSIYATPTDGVTLQASVSADKDLTGATVQWFYQSMTLNDQGEWEYGEWAALGEPEAFTAEGRQATLTRVLGDAELYTTTYRCMVVDGYANVATADYYVQVGNTDVALVSFDYDSATGVPYGEPAVLKTKLDGEPTGDLNYTWYQEEETWARIDDQNGPEFTTPPVTARKAYRFVVTDRYWNRKSDTINVFVENHLSANAVGDSDVYVAPKGSVTLAVDASCDDGTLYYQWVRQVYSPEEGWTDQIIENGTGATCTIDPVTASNSYWCRVRDRAGNMAEVYFSVTVENQLTANARGGVEEFAVSSGDSLTLEVEASAVDADSISYEWQEGRCNDDNEWEWTKLEDQNGATLALENITDKAKYQCTVRDSYGSSEIGISFTVNVVDPESVTALTLGTDTAVEINNPGERAMFSFTPDEDGLYLFTASENVYESLVGTVYDASLDVMATDTAGGANGDFRVMRRLQANTLYYLSAGYDYDGSTGSFSVRLDKLPVTALTAGETATTNIETEYQIAYFSFTPAQTGYYSFESLCDYDTYGYLYDENLQVLEENDDDGENGNFRILRELTEGTIYHFGARYNGVDTTDSFNVLLKRYQGLVDARAAQESFTVTPETETTLKVDAICTEGETLSYQWVLDGVPLDGATTDSYTLQPTEYVNYRCEVSDAYGHSRDVWFSVSVDNAVTAQAVGESNLSASMGDTVPLEVTASCTVGELSYQWFEDYTLIEGATQASYTTKPFNRSSAYYECCVTDQYGASANVSFYVECGDYIDNQFHAWTDASSIEVSPTEQTTLQVNVSASDMEGVTYRWSYLSKSLDVHGNMVDGEWVSIPEANGASYTLSGADAFTTTYRCEVSDKYWNTANVDISVLVNSELTTNIDGEHSNANVFYGETATLVVTASDADAIIHWYENRENDWYYIETSEDGRLVIPEATADVAYRWVAIDRYLRTSEGYVDVNVENDLNVTVANGLDKIAVATGNDVALALAISCLSGPEALSYQWYRLVTVGDEEYSYQEWQAIEGANERQYTVASVTEDGEYRCDISDRCGGWTQVEFTVVCVDNTGVTALALREEQSVTLENVGQQAMFSYTPDKTDMYVFESSNNDYRTLRGAIFDADWNNIASNLAGGPDNNFRAVCRLEAGRPYYFGAWHESEETGSFTVRLDRYDVTELTEGVSAQATISGEGQRAYFSFTPQETGYYAFASSGAEYATIGYRYDGAMQETMGETGWNDFSIRCKLEQGETYYFAAAFDNYSDTGSFDVCMTALHGLISAEGENTYLDVAPETEVSLRVNAECARESELADLSYQWSREGEAIPGATTAEYTLTVTESASYTCTVSDNLGNNQDVSFSVSLNNGFSAWAETDSSPSVNMGETATLSVAATCRVGGLSYQWYRENEPIEGANEPSYTTGPISEYTNYYCAVSDEYGASDNVYFYVNCIEG